MARTKIPTAREIMQTKVVTVRADDEVEKAVRSLIKHGHSGAPVVDTEGRLQGVLSEHDCVRVMAETIVEGWPSGHVEQQMTREVETVEGATDVLAISTLFTQGRHRRLFVVEGDRLVGLISRRDLMKALLQMEKAIDHAADKTTYELIDERHRKLD